MNIRKPHLYGQDAVRPVQQSWNFYIVSRPLHRCFKCFYSSSELLLRKRAAKASSLPGFQHNNLLNLHVDDSIKQTQSPFVFSQLSFSFPECTMKSLTIVDQSIVFNFHIRVEVACTGICPYWGCLTLLHCKFRVLLTKRLAAISSFTQPSLARPQLNAYLPILAVTLSCSMSCCF